MIYIYIESSAEEICIIEFNFDIIPSNSSFRLLGAFARLKKKKATVSFVMSVRPHCTVVNEISHSSTFFNLSRKFVFLQNMTSTTGTLHEDLSEFLLE